MSCITEDSEKIRKEIAKIYSNPKKSKKLREGQKKLYQYIAKLAKKNY